MPSFFDCPRFVHPMGSANVNVHRMPIGPHRLIWSPCGHRLGCRPINGTMTLNASLSPYHEVSMTNTPCAAGCTFLRPYWLRTNSALVMPLIIKTAQVERLDRRILTRNRQTVPVASLETIGCSIPVPRPYFDPLGILPVSWAYAWDAISSELEISRLGNFCSRNLYKRGLRAEVLHPIVRAMLLGRLSWLLCTRNCDPVGTCRIRGSTGVPRPPSRPMPIVLKSRRRFIDSPSMDLSTRTLSRPGYCRKCLSG